MIAVVIFSFSELNSTGKDRNYGKTPDEIFPYSRYQKAYKYHFLEPIKFLWRREGKETTYQI